METVLKLFGEYFFKFCKMSGYDRMLRTLGGNLMEFIENLDALHSYLALSYRVRPEEARAGVLFWVGLPTSSKRYNCKTPVESLIRGVRGSREVLKQGIGNRYLLASFANGNNPRRIDWSTQLWDGGWPILIVVVWVWNEISKLDESGTKVGKESGFSEFHKKLSSGFLAWMELKNSICSQIHLFMYHKETPQCWEPSSEAIQL